MLSKKPCSTINSILRFVSYNICAIFNIHTNNTHLDIFRSRSELETIRRSPYVCFSAFFRPRLIIETWQRGLLDPTRCLATLHISVDKQASFCSVFVTPESCPFQPPYPFQFRVQTYVKFTLFQKLM